MKLGIVVLNWNGKDVTPRCLDSIYRSYTPPDATIVVDNASSDGSAHSVREQFPQVVLVENDRNLGFAEGCNIGIQHLLKLDFDLVLLLNNDAEVDPGCLDELKRAAAAWPAAAYAATIYEHGDRGTIWYSGGTINRLILEARHEIQPPDISGSPRLTDFITGCCILFRSDALRQIGLLDTTFFAYYEDVDWCLRARASGNRLLYVPKASVYHEISHSFSRAGVNSNGGTSRFYWAQKRPVVLYLTYRNRLLLANKHAGGWHRLYLVIRCLTRAIAHAGMLCVIGQWARAKAVFLGCQSGLNGSSALTTIERLIDAKIRVKEC
jgi:GT2 family glycosyltransferase